MIRKIFGITVIGAVFYGSYFFYITEIAPEPIVGQDSTAITIVTGAEIEAKVYADRDTSILLYDLKPGDKCKIDYSRPYYNKIARVFPISCDGKNVGWAYG